MNEPGRLPTVKRPADIEATIDLLVDVYVRLRVANCGEASSVRHVLELMAQALLWGNESL